MSLHTDNIVNVAGHLQLLARDHPDVLAVAVPDGRGGFRRLSAVELDALSNRAANALRNVGLKRGTRTVLMVKPGVEFFVLTFALLKIGAVPVFIDPGMGLRKLGRCLYEAEPEAFIGMTVAHVARLLFFRRALNRVRLWVTVGPRLAWRGFGYDEMMSETTNAHFAMDAFEPHDVSAIMFTSGSTGPAKGAVYTHGIWRAQVDLLRRTYGIEPGERDLSTFPLFALFGPALGMAAIVPPMDASRPGRADPKALLDTARAFDCTSMFVNPALVDKLGRYAERHSEGPIRSLVRVISAGAPARPAALQRFARLLPHGVETFTPYGATEALPVANVGSKTILEETRVRTEAGDGVCVGTPVDGIEIAIIAITDEPLATWSDVDVLPDGEIGEIVVAGPVVSPRYYGRDDATRAVKIDRDGRLWHRMGDVGYVDGRGRLWMCGRTSHRVVAGERTLFTIPCEAIFNTHPAVSRSALVGVTRDARTVPVLCVELEPGADRRQVLKQLREIAREHEITRPIEHFLPHRGFPVDARHNAKIFREQVAVWADKVLQ